MIFKPIIIILTAIFLLANIQFSFSKEILIPKIKPITTNKKSNNQILTEGFESCESICMLGKRFKVELPICNAVLKILNDSNVNKVIKDLLARPLQFEK